MSKFSNIILKFVQMYRIFGDMKLMYSADVNLFIQNGILAKHAHVNMELINKLVHRLDN